MEPSPTLTSTNNVCQHCRKRPAQYLRAASGERLCLRCLFNSLERKVLKTIREERLIEPGDFVAVAVSGGKDSLVLLYILGKFREKGLLGDVKLEAFTINEGHPYSCFYRMSRRDFVRELAARFGIEYNVYHFKDIFGVTALALSEALAKAGHEVHMCTIDGVLRRRAMNIIGRRRGWTKIATAHNLDDEAQTVLLNVLMGNLSRFRWYGSYEDAEEKDLIPRIKPLKHVREEEIALYAYYHGLPLMELECPYVTTNPRYNLKFMLAELERKMPTVKHNLASFGERLSRVLRETTPEAPLKRCKHCGAPSARDVCRVCELFEKAGLLDAYLQKIRAETNI
jgi:cytoplasmic tRNA 2-thiolation protein 1